MKEKSFAVSNILEYLGVNPVIGARLPDGGLLSINSLVAVPAAIKAKPKKGGYTFGGAGLDRAIIMTSRGGRRGDFIMQEEAPSRPQQVPSLSLQIAELQRRRAEDVDSIQMNQRLLETTAMNATMIRAREQAIITFEHRIEDIDRELARLENEMLRTARERVNEWVNLTRNPLTPDEAIPTVDSTKAVEELEKLKAPSLFEKARLEKYDSFYSNYGGNIGVVKGYIINDKLFTTNEELISYIGNKRISFFNVKTVVNVVERVGDNLVTRIRTVGPKLQAVSKGQYLGMLFSLLFKLRIKDHKDSTTIFGVGKTKRPLVGEYLDTWDIESGNFKKLNGTSYYLNVWDENNNKVRFVLADCEIINKPLKGYYPPKDPTITIGSIVELDNKKLCQYKAEKDKRGEVISIQSNPSSKRISKKSRNRRLDLVTIKLLSGRTATLYAQDLKLIERREYVNNNQESSKKKSPRDWVEEAFDSFSFRAGTIPPQPRTVRATWPTQVTAVDFEEPTNDEF